MTTAAEPHTDTAVADARFDRERRLRRRVRVAVPIWVLTFVLGLAQIAGAVDLNATADPARAEMIPHLPFLPATLVLIACYVHWLIVRRDVLRGGARDRWLDEPKRPRRLMPQVVNRPLKRTLSALMIPGLETKTLRLRRLLHAAGGVTVVAAAALIVAAGGDAGAATAAAAAVLIPAVLTFAFALTELHRARTALAQLRHDAVHG